MAEVFYEDFEGTDGVALSTSNTAFDVISGTGNTSDFDTAQKAKGNSSGLVTVASTGTRILEGRFATEYNDVWSVFYFRADTIPSVNVIISSFYCRGHPDMVSQVRLLTTGRLVLRDQYTQETWTSPVLSADTWYRIAHRVNSTSNTHELKLYLGDSLTVVTDGSSGSTTMDVSPATNVDTYYVGVIQSITGAFTAWYDDLHISNSAEWFPSSGTPGNVVYSLRTNYATSSDSTVASWLVDADASTGTVTLEQLTGTSASVSESPTANFTITNPSGTDDLVFRVQATNSGQTDTKTITMRRTAVEGSRERPAVWVKTASGWK